MAITDLISQARKSRLGKAISNVVSSVDRDKEREGFQFISPQQRQSISQASQRVVESGALNPFAQLKGFSRAVAPADYGQRTKELFQPLIGEKRAGQLGYGLQGATQLTPFYAANMTDRSFRQRQQQAAPQTESDKTAQQIGRSTYGLALTAPLGGANLARNVATRAVGGVGVGAGLGAGISAITGGDVTQGARQGALSGYSFAPLGAITNPLTERVLRGAPGALQGQLGQRAIGGIANVIEDELQSFIDGYDTDMRSRITSLAIGAALTGNKQAIDNARQQLKSLGVKNADQIVQKTQSAVARQTPITRRNFDGKAVGAGELVEVVPNKFVISQNVEFDQSGRPVAYYEGGEFNRANRIPIGEQRQTTTNIFGQEIAMPPSGQAGFIDISGEGLTPNIQAKIPEPEKLKSSRTRIERKEKASPKLRTFQGKEIEQTGLKLPKKQAGSDLGSGKKSDSSSVIISRDKKYSFNINKKKLGLNAQQSKQLDDVVEAMRPFLEKNKGKTLTKNEIIEGGRKAKVLEDVVGREEAKAFADSLQASRNLLRSEQSQVGITPKFLEQLEIVSSVAADAGRRLQAFNIGAEDITIKEKLLRDILKTGATAEEVLKAGRKVDWNDAKQVTDFYRKFKPATFAEKLDEFRYTNMLSSPNTHINNAFSNFLQTAVLAPIEKTVRGTVDFAQSKLTGKEQEYFARQGVDYAKGYWKALPEAIDVFRKTLAGVEGLRKPDVEFIPTSTSKLRQIYTLPLQALEASDQFFRTLIKAGEIESLKTEGITGAKASKIAEQQADYRVFRQAFDPEGKLGQNKVLQVWDKWNSAIQNLRRVPGGSYLVPFLQTPTNILKQGFEYSPLGVFTVKGSANPQEQLAKTIIGSSVFTAAYALANSGLTTWDTPTNSTQRSEFYAAGLQPYSVKIGDKWVSYSKLGPLAYPIAMASALKWAQDNGADEDQLATIGSAMAGTLGFFADQSYVRGIGDMIDAFRGDEYKQARAFGNIPSQMIPYRAAMGWIARLIDPVYRKASGGTVVEQIGKGMISQIPFASRSLEAYKTPFGTESQRQFPGINAFSPLSISQERPQELEYYNARQNMRDENKKVDKILKQIEAGKDVSTKELNANKLATKQAADLTKKKIEAGITVTQQELETAYLNKPLTMPKSNRYEKSLRDSELWSKTGDILRDENLSDAQKSALNTKIATELGVTPQDIETYQVAKQDNAQKTLYVLDQIDKMQSSEELLQFLSAGRKPVNGKILISDGVITNLVNDGLIPEALGKQLKNLDFNADGTVKKKKSSGGKAKKSAQDKALEKYLANLAKISLPSGKIRTQAPIKIDTKSLTFGS